MTVLKNLHDFVRLIEPWIAVIILVIQICLFVLIKKKRMEMDANITKAGSMLLGTVKKFLKGLDVLADTYTLKRQNEKKEEMKKTIDIPFEEEKDPKNETTNE